jgi:hypothetical protein
MGGLEGLLPIGKRVSYSDVAHLDRFMKESLSKS